MESSTMADAVYEVEQILDKSTVDGQTYYLVRWKDFTNDWDTWEPSENLNDCQDLKDKYESTSKKKCDNSPKSSPKKSPQSSPRKGSNVASSPKPTQSPQKVGKGEKSKSSKTSSPKSSSLKDKIASKGSPKKAVGKGTPTKDNKGTSNVGKRSIDSVKGLGKGKKNISDEEKVKKKVKKKDSSGSEMMSVKESKKVKEKTGKEGKRALQKKIERMSSSVKKSKAQVSTVSSKLKHKSSKDGKLKVKLANFKKKNLKGKDRKSIVKESKGDSLESIIDAIVAQAREEVKSEKSKKSAKNMKKKEKKATAEKADSKKIKLPKKRKSEDDYEIIDFSTSDSDSENETLYSISVKNKTVKTDKPSSPKKSSLSTGNVRANKTSPKLAKLLTGKASPKISKSSSHGNAKGAGLTVESVKRRLEVKPIRVKPLNSSNEKSSPGSAKKKIRLIDSIHKEKAMSNILRPVSPTPVFTTFKPINTADHTALVTMATASASSATPLVIGDVPVYHYTPHHLPVSPSSMSYKTLLDSLPSQTAPKKPGKRREGEDSQEEEGERVERRISVRQSECAFRYKEIVVRKCQRYTQIWLNTQTKLKNSLNPQVIQEVVSALNSAKYDDSSLVMYSGIGNVFCSGIDLNFLISGDRKVVVRQMVDALRDFTKALITFPKPIVAVVNGPAIGLGMTMLPLCDIVYASDKANFYLPYSQLSQTPEGCASFTLPQSVGMAMANELLIGGRRITAIEACNLGLVSQVFWPTSMMQEVVPKVQNIALTSAKALETTKLLVRSHQRTKLELTNESESNLLMERWQSSECQKAIENFLNNEKNFSL